MPLRRLIVDRIKASGPLTVAQFMDLALYEPELGYYAARDVRSGRQGDFYTSVDVGPLFGELLSVQLHEMWSRLGEPTTVTLAEAGAGNGRLARDVLDAISRDHPRFYDAVALHLVETSRRAREAQRATLGPHAKCLTGERLPDRFCGIVYCNELLDALPTHVVVMTDDGLREIMVSVERDRLVEVPAEPSTPALEQYLARASVQLERGWRAEVNLRTIQWVRDAARRLTRGFLVIVDYGHEAHELYSERHASGTLTGFRRHQAEAPQEQPGRATWLVAPGQTDLTAHVDFSSVRAAAQDEGLVTLGLLDQTYFLLGLGATERLARTSGSGIGDIRARMAAKTLLLPGGLGSSHKVLLLGKGVGTPSLRGCSAGGRVT